MLQAAAAILYVDGLLHRRRLLLLCVLSFMVAYQLYQVLQPILSGMSPFRCIYCSASSSDANFE
jgi:hypothetical protein